MKNSKIRLIAIFTVLNLSALTTALLAGGGSDVDCGMELSDCLGGVESGCMGSEDPNCSIDGTMGCEAGYGSCIRNQNAL